MSNNAATEKLYDAIAALHVDLGDFRKEFGEQRAALSRHDEEATANFSFVGEQIVSINDHLGAIDKRLKTMDGYLADVDERLGTLQRAQTAIAELGKTIDNHTLAIHSDIKEIYDRLVKLEKRAQQATRKGQISRLQSQLDHLQRWAERVSAKTGVPLPKL